MPNFATIFALMLMGSIGLPLTIGFVGEFLSLLGFFKVNLFLAILGGSGIILSASYMLRVYKRSFFGEITKEANRKLKDLSPKELSALIPLALLVIILGVYPKHVLKPIDLSVKKTLILMEEKADTKAKIGRAYRPFC
jgi:NADH-quinone oxidoreductase subunit M